MLIDQWDPEDELELSTLLSRVCAGTRFDYENQNDELPAARKELQTAISLLRDYTRAIFFAQKKLKPKEVEKISLYAVSISGLFYPKLAAKQFNFGWKSRFSTRCNYVFVHYDSELYRALFLVG